MKKVIIAMAAMFLLVVFPGPGIWGVFLSPLIGGGVTESYLYPIYVGIVLLAGLVVGCTVMVMEEIKSLKEKIEPGNSAEGKNEGE